MDPGEAQAEVDEPEEEAARHPIREPGGDRLLDELQARFRDRT
ncbi:hypothetical protein ACFFWA_29130 [Actinomadura verrucosospora]